MSNVVKENFIIEKFNIQIAIQEAYKTDYIGKNTCDNGTDFDILFIHRSTNAYIGSEETANICLIHRL
ncbi:unnamed protein product [Rotaria sordida]|uniref:Uncharacterized protein n=1 Tax=Rotaria sordida TaxID=392033 RepID=A0A814RRG8_9BILA|nr:unnamed protein product [Rotaria sordida]